MSSDIAIKVESLSKCYQIYDTPRDRLKQFILPHMHHLTGQTPRQYFREFWALKDVSFEVEKGETIGIIGKNGSGKSTLLQMICGTVTPTTGSISTRGRVAALLELGAGFNTEFTGRENVLLNAVILGFPREAMEKRMVEVLAFSELGDFLEQPVKTYSSGMYARLAFSIAIHVDPEILIIDEALAVGDARFVAKCMRRIKEIQERGATILFVSHDVSSVRTLCQRAIWLDGGRIIEDGDVFPVTGKYTEFMFRDDLPEQQVLQEEIEVRQSPLEGGGDSQWRNSSTTTSLPSAERSLDARPVTHWGSRKGIILGTSICDVKGESEVIGWGNLIEVLVELNVPADIPREHLSVAVSIKDLKGTDLIVSTTQDREKFVLPEKERFTICYRFVNPLVTGKYLLVVAVENRLNLDIHYYEYLEGARYFSSLADERFFGLFQPPIEQQILDE